MDEHTQILDVPIIGPSPDMCAIGPALTNSLSISYARVKPLDSISDRDIHGRRVDIGH